MDPQLDDALSQWAVSPSDIKYRIYPSLLDKFQQMLDYEDEAEQPWNIVSEKAATECRYPGKEAGDYILLPEEMYDKLERELIDTINRAPREPSEAADKGTCLNEIVDCMVLGKPCTRDDMTITSVKEGENAVSIVARYNGFEFGFDPGLCRLLRGILAGSMCQVYLCAPMMTECGGVLIYGYADYWNGPDIIDLKSTSSYSFGKYSRKWQRHAYPWCAVESGLADEVKRFVYLAAQIGKRAPITGQIYPESYDYDHRQSGDLLKSHIEAFIRWLESRRELITDKKIFNIIEV